MDCKTPLAKRIAKTLHEERKQYADYCFSQTFLRNQITRKEYDNDAFVQNVSWKKTGYLLKYQ